MVEAFRRNNTHSLHKFHVYTTTFQCVVGTELKAMVVWPVYKVEEFEDTARRINYERQLEMGVIGEEYDSMREAKYLETDSDRVIYRGTTDLLMICLHRRDLGFSRYGLNDAYVCVERGARNRSDAIPPCQLMRLIDYRELSPGYSMYNTVIWNWTIYDIF